MRAATDALHAAGLEAILDVVFNHDGESDQFGPTLSFRGLDNAAWFRLDPRDPAALHQRCRHRQLPCARPSAGHPMAIGALRRWMIHGGFDGFRFDLGIALGRRAEGFDPKAPLLPGAGFRSDPGQGAIDRRAVGRRPGRIPARPVRPRIRRMERPLPRRRAPLLARRRRAARAKSQPGSPARATSSSTPPPHPKASTSSSPTMVSPLRDLVSYAHKHNEANGENNRDGTDNNLSWNHGVEGPSEDPAILERARATSAICSRCCSPRGARRCSAWAWSWASARAATTTPTPRTTRQARSTGAPPTLRSSPSPPGSSRLAAPIRALSRDAFLTGAPFDAAGLADVEWRDADGPMTESGWNDPAGAVLIAVFAAPQSDGADRVAVAMNRSMAEAEIRLARAALRHDVARSHRHL